jgi:hypothetical protein
MNPLLPPDQDCTEIRLLRSLAELNYRLLTNRDPNRRTQLRETMEVLRQELVKMVENFPIYSESEVQEAQTSPGLMPHGVIASRHC